MQFMLLATCILDSRIVYSILESGVRKLEGKCDINNNKIHQDRLTPSTLHIMILQVIHR